MLGPNGTVLVVAAIIALVIVYNNVMARKENPRPAGASDGGHDLRDLLSKFVHHDGSVVGETVAVDGDRLVLKQAGVFKAVPVGMAAVVEDEVQLHGPVDWASAEEAGTAWRNKNTKGPDADVAGALTRSEDVRNPAMQAMKARLEEE